MVTCCADQARDGERRDNALAEILLESTAALGTCGEADRACRLAGRAYAALRRADPAMAHRFDVLLHRLVRLADV
jgi:hypothetical protein